MAFDPDAYLASTAAPAAFDPDEYLATQPAQASTFANKADVANYAEHHDLATGDNGVGAWGDDTTSETIPQVALPRDTITDADHGRPVHIMGVNGRVFTAYVTDKMPRTDHITNGASIDLNPAAAALAGHSGGVAPVRWRFADVPSPGAAPAAFDPDAYLANTAPTAVGTPNTVLAAPDDRPATEPDVVTRALDSVDGALDASRSNRPLHDVVAAAASMGGKLIAGVPGFVQNERAQYLESQPHPQADQSPDALLRRRAEITDRLAAIDDENAHGDGPPLPPSLEEQRLRAELATLTPEGQTTATATAKSAADARQAADRLAAAQGLVKKGNLGDKPTLDLRIADALGGTGAALVPGVGMLSIASDAANSARGAAEDKARADGLADDAVRAAGDAAANTALEHTAAALPAYMVAGSVAGKLSKAITPETASAIRKFLTEGTAATGANVAASAAVRAGEELASDKPDWSKVSPTMEGFFGADLPFALSHAIGAARAEDPQARIAAVKEAMKDDADDSRTPPITPTTPSKKASSSSSTPAEVASPREPVAPTFAAGDTPQERADNFLQPPDDQPAPSAVAFQPDEEVPAELSAAPRVVQPDGSTVVFDPELHTPEQFSGLKLENPPSAEPDPEGIAHDEDEEPAPPTRTAEDMQRDRDLEAEYRAEQEREARAGIGNAGGVELLDAVREAGGLPTDDPVFRGELKNIREASAPTAQAGRTGVFNLFRRNAPTLDELTSRLRAHGFDVETPADVLELLNRRVTSKRPKYGFAARAEAQSGMSGSEAYFRRTPPRTPEELRPVQQRWKRALQMVAPKTALRLEVIKQDALDSLMGSHRPAEGSPHAAYLDGAIYLSEKALRDNTGQVNRVNFLHEIVHHFERALPEAELSRLRQQQATEMANGQSPLHAADGSLRPDVDPRVKDNFSEWLAERVAWDNEHHFAGEIDPAAAKTSTGRLAARVRQFVGRVWKTFRPQMPDDEVNARFRQWMGRGADANEAQPGRAKISVKGPDFQQVRGNNATVSGPALFAIRAHHGTPHEVDRFSSDKIGTGEGAQVYGHGLYFAQLEKVARSYQKGLTEKDFIRKVSDVYGEFDHPDEAEEALRDVPLSEGQRKLLDVLKKEDWWGFDYPHQAVRAALREPENYDPSPEFHEAIKSFGNLYSVHLDAEPDELLDWDKPLSEQGPKVQAAVNAIMDLRDANRDRFRSIFDTRAQMFREGKVSGENFYRAITQPDIRQPADPQGASRMLSESGVPGLRYLDQSSRSAGAGTHNYVMFDDSRIKITHKNGQVVEGPQFAIRHGVDENGVHSLAKPIGEAYKSEDERQRDPAQILRSLVRRGVEADPGQRRKSGRAIASHSDLVAWAHRQGAMLDPADFTTLEGGGGEHSVRLDEGTGRVYKVTKPGLYGSQAEDAGAYLQRWALHNRAVSDDAQFEGLVHLPGEDEPRAVVSQPFRRGDDSTGHEQADYLRGKGFHEIEPGRWTHPITKVTAWDTITDGNAITSPEGRVQPVDFQMGAATPDEVRRAQEKSGIGGEPQFAVRRSADTGTGDLFDQPKREDDFSLERATPEQLRAEDTRRQQKEAIADRMAKPLRGTAGDTTADIFGEGETPLFNERRDGDQSQFAIRQTLKGARQSLEAGEQKDRTAKGKDAAENRAGIVARQAANSVRLDFGSKKELSDPKSRGSRDLEAMPFVVEAAGIKSALQHDLTRVQNSSDAKLAKKYVPVVQHAIDNFDRLNALKGNYEAITDKQRLIERRHGINTPQVKNYVTRLLEMPEHMKEFEPVLLGAGGSGGGGGSRYFVKGRDFATLADAIEAGYAPKSTNIADLLERRIGTGQKLVQERRLWSQLRSVAAPGDALNRPIIGQMEEHTLPGGRKEMRLPLGYESITANGEPLVVHRQYAGLFKALYGDSKIRQSTAGRLLLNLTGIAKHGTLVFDTFHVGRVLSKELFGGYQTGYNKGLSLLEYGARDLGRAVAAGDITQSQAAYAQKMRPMADELIKAGLNVGRVADNLSAEAVKHLPVIGGFNQWVFGKLSRGAMLQTALTNYAKNLSRFPELGRDGAARRTATEMNEVFGNLGSQGLFQSKTMQDLARTVFLAPQWAESQIRAELRGASQLARVPLDAVRGKLRTGMVAQGMASGVIAMLAANQVINQMSRGQFTWQNKEDDRKLDAFIPGGKRGFWFSPFEIAAETLHQAHRLFARSESPIDALTGIAANKLSPLARGVKDLLSGRDFAGHPYLSPKDRVRAALLDAAPFPMPLNTIVEKDPRQTLGLRWSRQAGSLEKQVLQGMGMKVQNELSAEQKMFALGKQYRSDVNQAPMAGPYSELRRALADDNPEAAKDEIRWLVNTQHKPLAAIQESVGNAKPEKYAGPNKADNATMLKNLTPVQKEVYQQAQMEHRLNAQKFQRILAGMRAELAQKP